ncbi:hypothetical protein ACXR2T_15775 [Leucobacter sp. HY1910]
MKGKVKKSILASAVVVSGIAVGTLIGSVSGAAFADDPSEYKTNSNGLTLGTVLDAEELGVYPDLVFATATNGEEGYVFNAELEGETPKSPEEAATWNETHNVDRVINVYASDGETVIGEFLISKSDPSYDFEVPR